MEGKYFSTKKFGPISTGHRQWRDNSHCSFVHGYGRYVLLTFACDLLDERDWVMDFGGLKHIKEWIEAEWDHRTLIAHDDPVIPELRVLEFAGGINLNILPEGYSPGIESSCKYLYDNLNPHIKVMTEGRVWISKVEIWEHEKNSAIYVPEETE